MAPRISARDEHGKLREYESIIILRPDLLDEGIATVNKRALAIIEKYEGRLLHLETWGRRRLAYRIGKEQKGNYYYWRYLATAEVPGELKRSLRVLDSVLREFTLKLDENVDPEARPHDVDPIVLDPTQRVVVEEKESQEAEKEETGKEEESTGAGVEAEAKDEGEDTGKDIDGDESDVDKSESEDDNVDDDDDVDESVEGGKGEDSEEEETGKKDE